MAMAIDVEEWRAVAGTRGYEVSNLGRVRSYWISSGIVVETPRVLRPGRRRDAAIVKIRLQDGTFKTTGIHRLVLEAFVGPCPPGHEGCHYDGNPHNNRLENLRWDTHRNNLNDRIRHNTIRKGDRHPLVKIKLDDRETIRRLARRGFSSEQIAALFGTQNGTVQKWIRVQARNAELEDWSI